MFKELKTGLAHYFARFYSELGAFPVSQAVREFASRGLERSMVWTPALQIDNANDMLSSWRKVDNGDDGQYSPLIPIIMVAVEHSFIYSPEWQNNSREYHYVRFPQDEKRRAFKSRISQFDKRMQLAVFAADYETCSFLTLQLHDFLSDMANRRFNCEYRFAGFNHGYPSMIETPDVLVANIPLGQDNLFCNAVDVTIRATVPQFLAPSRTEDGDGRGNVCDPNDPPGWAVVTQVDTSVPPLEGFCRVTQENPEDEPAHVRLGGDQS